MQCHNKVITQSWLQGDENYISMLRDAFVMQELTDQKHSLRGEQRNQVDQELLELQEGELEIKPQPLRDQYLLTKDEQLKEYTIFKKGGTFSSLMQRKAIFDKGQIAQIKKSGGAIEKEFGRPTDINFELKDNSNKANPWDLQFQKYLARVVFQFEKHHPIWIYVKDEQEAQRMRDYFLCQNVIINMDATIGHMVKDSRSLMVDLLTTDLLKQIQEFAIKTAIQKKQAAKLSQKEKKFLEDIDLNLMRCVLLKKWKQYSDPVRRREEQMREIEDAQKCKLESVRQQTELKKRKWREFLEKKHVIKVDQVTVLRNFAVDWLEKSEEIMYHQQVKSLTFVWNFRSLNVEEHIYLIKPVLTVALTTINRPQNQSDLVKGSGLNLQQRQKVCSLKMDAYLDQQKSDKFYCWSLKEKIFENTQLGKTRLGEMQRKSCNIQLQDLTADDQLEIQFQDMINSFYDSNTLPFVLNIQDLLENSQQGRSIWIPMQLVQTTPLKTETKETQIILEVDIYVAGTGSRRFSTLDEELDYCCNNNYPILDPLYMGLIYFPKLNQDLVKIAVLLLQANTDCLKISLQILNYVLFMSNLDQNSFDTEAHKLWVLSVRKMIEYLCMNKMNTMSQYALYQKLSNLVQDQNFIFNKNPQINQNITDLYFKGIPYFLRNKVWFQLLKGNYRQVIQILTSFKVNPNARSSFEEQEQNTVLCESVWYYWKLLKFKAEAPKSLLQLLDLYLKQEDGRKAIVNESFHHMLKNMLTVFLVYQFKLGQSPNQLFVQHLFALGKQLLKMQNYHYIKQLPIMGFGLDDEVQVQQTFNLNQQFRECSYESRAFWLLICFSTQVLPDYPLFEANKSKRHLLEDCSKLRAFLKRKHRKLLNHIFLLGISFENVIFECFFNLYSDVLPSDLLYRVWDVILFQQQLAFKDTKERGVIVIAVLGALLLLLEDKIQYITTHQNLLMSLRIAAALIKNQDDFIILIIQTQKDILLAVQQEQDIEGPLQLEEQNKALIRQDMRVFDVTEPRIPKPSQQMSLHEYMNSIDF